MENSKQWHHATYRNTDSEKLVILKNKLREHHRLPHVNEKTKFASQSRHLVASTAAPRGFRTIVRPVCMTACVLPTGGRKGAKEVAVTAAQILITDKNCQGTCTSRGLLYTSRELFCSGIRSATKETKKRRGGLRHLKPFCGMYGKQVTPRSLTTCCDYIAWLQGQAAKPSYPGWTRPG